MLLNFPKLLSLSFLLEQGDLGHKAQKDHEREEKEPRKNLLLCVKEPNQSIPVENLSDRDGHDHSNHVTSRFVCVAT